MTEITDKITKTYCPRQFFYMEPLFKSTPFFKNYCANIPCRGDIDCNRDECWKMTLDSEQTYVQDDLIKISQKPMCPAEFFGRLGAYAHDCGVKPEKIFKQFRADFGTTEFCSHLCTLGRIECFGKKLKGQQFFENTCWPNLLRELNSHQK